MNIELSRLVNQAGLMASDVLVHTFIFLVIFDILTGIGKALVGKATESTRGLVGIVKHVLIVILCSFTYPYLQVLQFQMAARSFLVFFITIYGISIVENLGILGIPLPKFIKAHLMKLHHLSDDNQLNG